MRGEPFRREVRLTPSGVEAAASTP